MTDETVPSHPSPIKSRRITVVRNGIEIVLGEKDSKHLPRPLEKTPFQIHSERQAAKRKNNQDRYEEYKKIQAQRTRERIKRKLERDEFLANSFVPGEIVTPKFLRKKRLAQKRIRKREARKAERKRIRDQQNSRHTSQYQKYMRSTKWEDKRQEAFEVHGKQCNRCGGFRDLQVHHLTYERLGHEDAKTDLEVLCLACHENEHGRSCKSWDLRKNKAGCGKKRKYSNPLDRELQKIIGKDPIR